MLEGEIPPWTPANPFPYYDSSSESNTRGNSIRARRRGQAPMSESSATGARRHEQAPMSESGATGTRRHGQQSEARELIPPAFERNDPPLDKNPVILYRSLGDRRSYIISTLLRMHRVLNLERDFHTAHLHDDHLMQIERFMGKDQRIPVLFVKGKLIGGPDEVLKLEQEGNLRALFDEVPKDQFYKESWKMMSDIYNRRNKEMLDKYFPQLFKPRCTLM
ncbi:hypothetical protein FRX31_031322 [Thalictrum thalictroides]|uniref:Glutaredoxin domain-containing protein n=1 Tax=Thalictrum thalictroides TaxID=46969 RepID=A0A7J6V286_THATH|nr:hypothetical protein FRX31_031322 [Thalictrum thalictroides]